MPKRCKSSLTKATLGTVRCARRSRRSRTASSGNARPTWERYRSECETFRDTDQTHQSDTATRAAILIAYFGADYDVERLSKDAQRRYERARAAGGLRYRHERRVVQFRRVCMENVVHVAQPTRARSAEADR